MTGCESVFLALQIETHRSLGFGAGPFSNKAVYRKCVKKHVIICDLLRCNKEALIAAHRTYNISTAWPRALII